MAYKIVQSQKALEGLVLNQYVNIDAPDTYSGDPVYKFSTTLTGTKAVALAERIDVVLLEKANELNAKASPKRPYKRNDDGSVTFNFKIKEFKAGQRPFKVWDMKMNPMTEVPRLSGGSVINLNFAFYVSEFKGTAFLSLQPTHVQVKEAKVYSGNGPEPTFGAGEGYAADEDSDRAGPSFGNQSDLSADEDF